MKRKAVVASLEAVLAASIFLIFVVSVMPQITGSESDTLSLWKAQIQRTLENLDKRGNLRSPALNLNLTKIRSLVETEINNQLGFKIGIMYLNSTEGVLKSSNEYSSEFYINKSRSISEYLRLDMSDASSPAIYINSIKVWERQNNFNSTTEKINIREYTSKGSNNLTLNFSSPSSAQIVIERYYYVNDGTPEKGKDVIGVSHHIAGENKTFKPREVRILAWRR